MSWPETEQERLTRIADEWMEECTEWCFEGNRQELERREALLTAYYRAAENWFEWDRICDLTYCPDEAAWLAADDDLAAATQALTDAGFTPDGWTEVNSE